MQEGCRHRPPHAAAAQQVQHGGMPPLPARSRTAACSRPRKGLPMDPRTCAPPRRAGQARPGNAHHSHPRQHQGSRSQHSPEACHAGFSPGVNLRRVGGVDPPPGPSSGLLGHPGGQVAAGADAATYADACRPACAGRERHTSVRRCAGCPCIGLARQVGSTAPAQGMHASSGRGVTMQGGTLVYHVGACVHDASQADAQLCQLTGDLQGGLVRGRCHALGTEC